MIPIRSIGPRVALFSSIPTPTTRWLQGMIRRRAQELDELVSQEPARQRSTNVVWETTAITRAMREERNAHKAAVLWFTGLSGSGKSTVARLLERRLFAAGVQTFYLDGDNVRHGLNGDLGFSATTAKRTFAASPKWPGWPSSTAHHHLYLHLAIPGRPRLCALPVSPAPSFWRSMSSAIWRWQTARPQRSLRQGHARRDRRIHRRVVAL